MKSPLQLITLFFENNNSLQPLSRILSYWTKLILILVFWKFFFLRNCNFTAFASFGHGVALIFRCSQVTPQNFSHTKYQVKKHTIFLLTYSA